MWFINPQGMLTQGLFELSPEEQAESDVLFKNTGTKTLKAYLSDISNDSALSDKEKKEVMLLTMQVYRVFERHEEEKLPKPKGEG